MEPKLSFKGEWIMITEQETPNYDPLGASKDRAWQAIGEIAKNVSAQRPDKGKRVEVISGRKHLGKIGVVFWHGRNPFDRFPHRYHTSIQAAMSDAIGIHGFRIGIRTDAGEKFFTEAQRVKVLS
jgi:hypothetical protein